jgi:hypothetical protein
LCACEIFLGLPVGGSELGVEEFRKVLLCRPFPFLFRSVLSPDFG